MADLAPEQATASLARVARAAERANVAAIRRTAAAAVPLIEGQWPVLTGTSQDGWTDVRTSTGADVSNPVPYTSDVHDGLAFTLVPQVLSGLDGDWEKSVAKQLIPIFEGKR